MSHPKDKAMCVCSKAQGVWMGPEPTLYWPETPELESGVLNHSATTRDKRGCSETCWDFQNSTTVHHQYYYIMYNRVPYALPQRTSWLNIRAANVHFMMRLQNVWNLLPSHLRHATTLGQLQKLYVRRINTQKYCFIWFYIGASWVRTFCCNFCYRR